ncbi:MAG: sigma 54-interacting transcriptional regulator [Gemmatimonadaceae bacterium]
MNIIGAGRPMMPLAAVVIGDSPGMLDVIHAARRVAGTTASVLIQGERGTGKELLARFLHERSRRRAGPFIAVNGSTLDLDAFERARAGTLFLDDVQEMSPVAQASLLRVIEERVVEDLSGDRRTPVDVRLVAAAERELADDVAAGRFRADLYYSLAVIVLALPPLRDRGDDVRMLAEHFVGSFACGNGRYAFAIARETLSLLRGHPWPGNVRQLKETLERAASTAAGPVLIPSDLPPDIRGEPLALARRAGEDDVVSLGELERRHIMRVLR